MDIPVRSEPRISVCVPTRGRPSALARCLAALGRSTLPAGALEVVVVGDGPDVEAPPSGAAGDVPVVWRTRPRGGPAAARNLAAELAGAPTLAFLDDDCVPAVDWAERMLAAVDAAPGSIVAGRVRNGLPENRWATASQMVLDVVVEMYNARPGQPGFAPTSNLAMRRDVFAGIGGFDERFRTAAAEDRDFCDRSYDAGHPLVLDETAVVEHFHDLDARSFVSQAASYGRGEVTYREVCAERGRRPNVVRRSFYMKLLLAGLSYGPRRGVPLVGLAAASQLVFLANYWRAGGSRAAAP
jgi:GT2 family glycosyltransferase